MSPTLHDELDRRIINLLQVNARAPVSELAGKLGIARSTVHERIKKLEQRGVIRGYTVQLNEGLPGNEAQALVMLSVRQQNNRQLVERLATYPEIKICLAVSGQYDLFLEVATPLLEDLDSLLDEIADIPGVERSRSVIVLAKKFDRKFT
ncbi:MAG: Lrp/AsnC family transcriptional regulator [Methyloligellaceae bacterium]